MKFKAYCAIGLQLIAKYYVVYFA